MARRAKPSVRPATAHEWALGRPEYKCETCSILAPAFPALLTSWLSKQGETLLFYFAANWEIFWISSARLRLLGVSADYLGVLTEPT